MKTLIPTTILNDEVIHAQLVQASIEISKNFSLMRKKLGIGGTKNFFTFVREGYAIDWFTARGIKERYHSNLQAAIPNFFYVPAFGITNACDHEEFFLYHNLAKGCSNEVVLEHFNNVNGQLLHLLGKTAPKTKEPSPKQVKDVVEKELAELPSVKPTEMKREKSKASFNLELPLSEIVQNAVKEYIEDESGILNNITQLIENEAKKLQPNIFYVNKVQAGTIEGTVHKLLMQAVKLIGLERQLYIAGPAGTGKTTLASQIANAYKLRFAHISCSSGMSEAHLLGRMIADGSYVQSEFVDYYENGGVFLFDEIDAADPNTMLVINSALSNGHISVPNRRGNQTAKRHADFLCVCAANTWGVGSVEYAGRNILDAAFLDRFAGSRLLIGYDTELEKSLVGNNAKIFEPLFKIRQNVENAKIRRVVSTRVFVSAKRQTDAGIKMSEFIKTFMCGWSSEEVSKAMQNLSLA